MPDPTLASQHQRTGRHLSFNTQTKLRQTFRPFRPSRGKFEASFPIFLALKLKIFQTFHFFTSKLKNLSSRSLYCLFNPFFEGKGGLTFPTRIRWFRIQGFGDQKFNKFTAKNFLFFWSKIVISWSLIQHKRRPSYKRSLQLSKENIQRFKTLTFFYFFGSFCPPRSGSGSTDLIESGSGSETLELTKNLKIFLFLTIVFFAEAYGIFESMGMVPLERFENADFALIWTNYFQRNMLSERTFCRKVIKIFPSLFSGKFS